MRFPMRCTALHCTEPPIATEAHSVCPEADLLIDDDTRVLETVEWTPGAGN